MWHQDRYPTIGVGHTCHAIVRTIGIQGIARGDITSVVDISKGYRTGIRRCRQVLRRLTCSEACAPFSMRHDHRQVRACHVSRKDRRRLKHRQRHQTRLILLGGIALKTRPTAASRHQGFEVGEHLTAVANTQCKAIITREKLTKQVVECWYVTNRLGPPASSTEHITVGKPTAGGHTCKLIKRARTGSKITHVHIHRVKACVDKGRRHLHMPIHALLTQNRHPRLGGVDHGGLKHRDHRIKGQSRIQTRVRFIQHQIALGICSLWHVAQ